MKNEYSVALILEQDASRRIRELHGSMPVWALSTKPNREVAASLWAKDNSASLTLLAILPNESEGDLLCRALDAIEQHHGDMSAGTPFTILHVYGTDEVPGHDFEFLSVTTFDHGFTARK
jgi:hypothetical protein